MRSAESATTLGTPEEETEEGLISLGSVAARMAAIFGFWMTILLRERLRLRERELRCLLRE
jgi:hypothetical protein